MTRTRVLLDHDGGVDDYLAMLLLLTMDHVDVLGVVVTPADCYIEPAVSATRKILDLVGRHDVPVAESTVRGLNPFPPIFRRDAFCIITNLVPITQALLRRLSRQRRYPLSDLAGTCYALAGHQDYFAWDVLTTSYLGKPEMFTLRAWETEIVTAGPSQGRTRVVPGGRTVQALDQVDLEQFYGYLFSQWSR